MLIEESWAFSNKRATFGKKLIEHPVIRWKLAEMTRQAGVDGEMGGGDAAVSGKVHQTDGVGIRLLGGGAT